MITLFRIDHFAEKYDPDDGLYYRAITHHSYLWIDDNAKDEFCRWIGNDEDLNVKKLLEIDNYNDLELIRRAIYDHN